MTNSLAVIDGLEPNTPVAVIHRLGTGVELVREVMASGEWLTIPEIQKRVEEMPNGKFFSESCISARIRDQRKPKHGSHTIARRLRGASRNLYEYSMIDEDYPEAA